MDVTGLWDRDVAAVSGDEVRDVLSRRVGLLIAEASLTFVREDLGEVDVGAHRVPRTAGEEGHRRRTAGGDLRVDAGDTGDRGPVDVKGVDKEVTTRGPVVAEELFLQQLRVKVPGLQSLIVIIRSELTHPPLLVVTRVPAQLIVVVGDDGGTRRGVLQLLVEPAPIKDGVGGGSCVLRVDPPLVTEVILVLRGESAGLLVVGQPIIHTLKVTDQDEDLVNRNRICILVILNQDRFRLRGADEEETLTRGKLCINVGDRGEGRGFVVVQVDREGLTVG